jgi:23S rRNA pseudouridine2605 synthase
MRRRVHDSRGPRNDDNDHRPRLQKVLAAAGLGSRRKCEELISEGRVEVDRRVVTKLGTRVDPAQHEIRVDGEPLPRPKRQYFLLNKPAGVVSTARDPSGRPRVIDLVGGNQRLFPVGRLDLHSEGLILVTNDGELANLLMHPRYGVEKTYLAQVAGVPSREAVQRLERGVHLAEGYAHAKRVHMKKTHGQSAVLEIVLDEGRNRELRRLLARIGHKVLRLRRTALGPLRLGTLAPGEYRPLRTDEVQSLRDAALAPRTKRGPEKHGKKTVGTPTSDIRRRQEPPPVELADVTEDFPIPSSDEPVREEGRPVHTGTIIGFDEGGSDVEQTPRNRPPTGSPTQARPIIKPIIDVRRGIFPGQSNDDDDFADDEPVVRQPPPRRPSPRKPAARDSRRPRHTGKPAARDSRHPRPTGKPHGAKRKGGRR